MTRQRFFYFNGMAYQDITIDGETNVYDERFEKIIESSSMKKAKKELLDYFKKEKFDRVEIEISHETDGLAMV